MYLVLGSIKIPFDPFIFGGVTTAFSWHGFLTFVAVATAVWMAGRAAVRYKLDQEQVYNTAMWGVLAGIVGARIVHVADRWGDYSDNLLQIFAVWEGGIGLWGGILGGWLGGLLYGYIAKVPIGKFMDIAAVPLLVAQTIGRIGDVINGEHWSRALDLPWGWFFTDVDSPARVGADRFLGDPERAAHPAAVYEMITNIIIICILYFLRDRLRPAGSLFMLYLALYATARFAIQFIRLDDVKFWGLQEAHIIAVIVWVITIPFLLWKTRLRPRPQDSSGGSSGGPSRTSAGRSRRERQRAHAR